MSGPASTATSAAATARVILLGASNASKGISLLIDGAEQLLGTPLEIHAAIGHGRSYGQRSFLIARSIDGTLTCPLWERVQASDPLPGYALLTDIGNDIMYDYTVSDILAWVDECLARLRAMNARTIVTGLPVPVIHRIGKGQYLFFRTLFFPKNRRTLKETVERVFQVHEGVRELAARHGAIFVEQKAEWYGLDPIHITQRTRGGVWGEVLSHWREEPEQDREPIVCRGSAARFLRVRTKLPEHWRLFGAVDLGRKQPVVKLPTGTRVSMY